MVEFNSALQASVRIGTPILFAGLGEVLLERSGIINIGIEGVMLGGAFSGFCAGWYWQSPMIGACAGMAGGALMMLVFAFFVLRLSADQIVTGMAINLVALGITGTAWLKISGLRHALEAPTFKPLLDSLAAIPILGPLFFSQTLLTWLAFACIGLLWFYFERSERGLELRAVGENPDAAQASGINVLRCRWKACVVSGALVGLGGAFLTISQTGSFAPNCTQGRGFVALAAVVLGRYGAARERRWRACFLATAFYSRDALSSDVPNDLGGNAAVRADPRRAVFEIANLHTGAGGAGKTLRALTSSLDI